MSFPLVQKKQVKESDGFELDSCVMLVTDTITRNRTYFPHDEVEKVVDRWKGLPINLNHERDDIRTVVGHLEDVRLEGNKLMCRPVFDEGTKEYDTTMGFMKSRFKAGDNPNVSVGLWANGTSESVGEEKDVKILREHEPDHLAIVVRGSCDSDIGCGIGLSEKQTITIPHEEYVDGSKDEYNNLKKEIIKEKISLRRLNMTEEQTMEELRVELEKIKRKNLERELAAEKAKLEADDKAKIAKETEELREKIKKEVLEEMTGTSTVPPENDEKVNTNQDKWDTLSEGIKEKYNLKGESYEDMTRKISNGGFKGAR